MICQGGKTPLAARGPSESTLTKEGDGMLRKSALLILLVSIALPALAAKQINVEQLEQILAAGQDKSPTELAEQLAGLELTERLTSARLAQLRSGLSGKKSQEALTALADASAFLDPPSTDIPATATPDAATQRHIMAMTVDYLGKTLRLLPNLFAARDTMRFENRPETLQKIASTDHPMHVVSKSRVTVLYRDGREFVDAGAGKDKKNMAPDKGLTTWGEFGPILGIVLFDAAHSRLNWSHWELAGGGPQAVFRYSVPKEKSHYDLRFCCVAESYGFEINVLTQRVGYHGEITVDPDTGTILRLTILPETDPNSPISQAAIAVEYGPVEIGGKTYFCPVRGIALAHAPDLKALSGALNPPSSTGPTGPLPILQKASLTSISQGPRQTLLNDIAFREFHLFRGDSKIVTGDLGEAVSHPSAPPPTPPLAASAASSDAAVPTEETAVDSSTLAPQPTEVAAVTVPSSGPPPEPIIPEITVAEANGVPDAPSLTQEGTNSAVTLRLTARLVDVPLVALDKKGRPIANLKPEDLEIYDDGHKVDLRSFVLASGAALQPAAANSTAPSAEPSAPGASHAYSNRTFAPVKTAGRDLPGNTIVLLIDNNISWGDLTSVREQMRTFLNGLHGDERVALYVMRAGTFQILQESTTNHALVATTLAHWTPSAQNISLGQEQEARNRQTMDYVRKPEDLAQVNGHTQIDSTGNQMPTDPKLQVLGDDPGRNALSVLVNVASHLGAIPGHKSLVWIASDNVLADWTNSSFNIDKGARIIQASVLHAQEAMNEAHVSVYPLDASRLEAGGIDASIGTRNVALSPTYPTGNKSSYSSCGLISGSSNAPELSNGGDISDCQNDLRPGRAMAQMQQDLHPIQGAYRELADATGGRVFRRSSDIVSEFNSVAADGRATYLLSFTPALAADGKYHLITVKLVGRKNVELRYRSGFFYREEPNTIKDRFREAVLAPEDATEITLSADSMPGTSGHTFKLNITAADLAIAQKDAFWTDKLDIYLVQMEVSGSKAHVTGQSMGLRLKPSTYQQYLRDGIPFNQMVEVAPGVGSVRIVVLDENSGRMGSVTIPAAALKINL
jgi:VWFA-related protein